LKAID